MKKIIIITIFISLLIFPWIETDANSGPPVNVSVSILNVNDDYDIDLFIPYDHTLTESDILEAQNRATTLSEYDDYYQETYPSTLVSFQDKDGFVSNTLYGESSYFFRYEHEFYLYMSIPRIFKIVLIKNNEFIMISEVIVMEAYDEHFNWDLEGIAFSSDIQYDVGSFQGLNENPFYDRRPYQELVIRIIITIMIELTIFYVMGYRLKQTFIFYGVLNVITQTLLTLGLLYGTYLGNGLFGNFLLLILGEIIVFGVEMGANGLVIKEKYTAHIVFSTFLSNLASLIFGTVITIQLYRILL